MKKKQKKIIKEGFAYINTTFNNTIISITDIFGNVICWSSSGQSGFKGSRKNTPYAAQIVAKNIYLKTLNFNLENLNIIVKGRGAGRDNAVRTLANSGFNILSIEDKTPISHNGCRPPKKRRV